VKVAAVGFVLGALAWGVATIAFFVPWPWDTDRWPSDNLRVVRIVLEIAFVGGFVAMVLSATAFASACLAGVLRLARSRSHSGA
jgi:hypothetical protein